MINKISSEWQNEVREVVNGTIPTEDNSSITSSNEAFLNFQNMVLRSVYAGLNFDNANTGGLVQGRPWIVGP